MLFNWASNGTFLKLTNNTYIVITRLAYFIAPGNGRVLERDDSGRTAFQVIEEANSNVGNLRSMYCP